MKLRIVLLLSLLFLLSVSPGSLVSSRPGGLTIWKQVELENSYVLVENQVSIQDTGLRRLTFSTSSNISMEPSLVYARIGEETVSARRRQGEYSFDIPPDQESVTIFEVYSNTFELLNQTLYFRIPLTLSPRETASDVRVQVSFQSQNVFIERPLGFNMTGYLAEANYTNVEPGTTEVFQAIITPEEKVWLPSKMKRRVLVDEPGKAMFSDEIIVENLLGWPIEEIVFQLPPNATDVKVHGELGPYVGTKAGSFNVIHLEESTTLTVKPRAPPSDPGDQLYLRLEYHLSPTETVGRLWIPLFFSHGLLLENYSITVEALGSADFDPQPLETVIREGYTIATFHLYRPLLDHFDDDHGIYLKVSLDGYRRYTPYVFLIGVAAAIIAPAALYVKILRPKRLMKVRRAAVVETAPVASEVLKEIHDLYRQKVRLLEEEEELRDRRLEGKISRHIYQQRRTLIKSRLSALDRDISKAKLEAQKASPRLSEVLRDIEEIEKTIRKGMLDIQTLDDQYRRGLLYKAEYTKKRSAQKGEIEEARERAYRLIESLR